jgi:hypothetical protein
MKWQGRGKEELKVRKRTEKRSENEMKRRRCKDKKRGCYLSVGSAWPGRTHWWYYY